LKALFLPYREGKCPVFIDYRSPAAACRIQLGSAWSLTLHDDLLRDLSALLGAENVQVTY
jgi:DNA polymerase-3 subunit alpha